MIVVIGATSFIGTYLVDALAAPKRSLFATGRGHSSQHYYRDKGIPYARLDITQKEDFEKLPRRDVEAVILLASLLPANVREYDPQKYVDVNITGTLNTLEYCRRSGAKKIIFASSHSDVAGLWDCGRPITEEDPRSVVYTGDHAVYLITKLAGMDLVEHYHQEYGLQGISFRLPAVYGYGPHTEIYVDGVRSVTGFKIFIEKAMAGEPIEVWGDASKGRDIVYVKDVAAAFLGAIDSNTAQGLYNIATGVRMSLDEEARGIVDVFSPPDRRSQIVYRPDKPNNMHTYLYDIGKAKRDLGYSVQYPYRRMLEDYKREMGSNRFLHLVEREHKE
ncbi:MAG: NAD(P)-dependent oxidoreductase [Phycisphaerae bacterium]